MNTILVVDGMTCSHCESSVTKALEGVSGVSNVDVDLETKVVKVEHSEDVKKESLKEAVEDIGFDVSEIK
ncbi:heavy metal-associated domain-containing protein [Lagierella sp.]|uniref:heavy-metal-associated domain-containing protein n=1 Tax=Lagierella sp. TaxID=2849657 RepID=UPI00262FFACC|nr:heavy metal-associated domain-containing protein [Lagierella sp.]